VHNTDELMSAIGGLFMTTKPDRSKRSTRRLATIRRRRGAWARVRGLTGGKILASVAVDFSNLKAAGAVV